MPESSSRSGSRPPSPGARASGDSRTVSLSPGSGSSLVRRGGSTPPGMLEEQPTVISKNPLSPAPVHFGALSPNELGRILEGERLGHFELHEFIGGGGMGAVFRALDTMLNRIVAVKVLSQDQSSDEESLKRFKNEAQSAARLDHANISRVYYVGEDRGLHYIVFEYIEGINLRDLVLRSGQLAIEDAISYTLQIADALDHASTRDVVHRDIKPSNVLITPDGKAKVVDMGLARLHQIAQPDEDLTASGVTLGTFDYISPEQARDPRAADVRSDLYSLGCTLYFLLTGRPPFPEGTVLQKLLQHQGDEPPDPRAFREDLPDELNDILRKLMSKSPAARYQTPAELAAALLELSADLGVNPNGGDSAIRAAVDARQRPSWERHLPWALPLAALLLVIGVLNWIWSPNDADADALPPLTRTKTAVHANNNAGEPKTNSRPSDKGKAPLPSGENGKGTPPADDPPTPAPEDKKPAIADEHPSAPPATPIDGHSADDPLSRLARRRQDGLHVIDSQGGLNVGALTANLGSSASSPPDKLTRASGVMVAPDAAVAVPRKGVLIVAGPDNDSGAYSSLHAACAAAQNNDVIELRFNGRLDEKPFTLKNAKLKIRAAEGFQPVIAFHPTGDAALPRSMLTVAGGQLTLINVALELDLSQDAVAESWALFDLQQAEAVRLDGCWLTIRNASATGGSYHDKVAFFDVTVPAGRDAAMLMPNAPLPPTVSLELKNCVARGEASFVRSNELQPVHLQWDNGFLATSERLWTADGGEHRPLPGTGAIQIDLRHLTAVTRSGLCRLYNSPDAPHQLDADIQCEDGILIGGEMAALVEQFGVDRVQDFQQRLSWDANRNFYEDFTAFWRIRGSDSGDAPLNWTLAEWREHWGADHENLSGTGRVVWQQPPDASRPPHLILPADYALSLGEDNPARGAAGDGRNVGAILEQLPPPPASRTPKAE